MNKTLKASGLAIALGLGGCGSDGSPPVRMSAAEVDASIQKSLERLRTLEIFSAERLVLDLPAEATACYGVPCNDQWRKRDDDEGARQAPRLDQLAALAEAAQKDTSLAPRAAYDSEAAVQALASLQIVQVDSLVEAQPKNNPECYNLPCPSDREEADRVNGVRVAQAFAIAEAAKKNGL